MENKFIIEPFRGFHDVLDDNVDVFIELEDGSRYTATLFTIENLKTLMDNYKSSGECLHGSFFWASNMLIVDNLSIHTINSVINELLKTSEFFVIFSKLS